MDKLKELFIKYRESILYLFFGILTVIINLNIYYILAHILLVDVVPSTIIAWICAVVFAFVTNKLWVFTSEKWENAQVLKEITSFFIYRVLTGFVDTLIMYVCVDRFHFDDIFIKIISNIIVIILNYLASKFVIFKKK